MADEAAGQGPRVLHVIPEDGTGGVEVAARMVLGRADLACRFQLLFILNPTGGVRARHVKGLSNLSWTSLSAYRTAFRRMRASDADVMVFSLWKAIPLLILARLFLRARIVYFLHLEIDSHVVDAVLSWIAIRMAHVVWADSEAAIVARGVPASKPSRVISFVTERLAPAGPGPVEASFVSWGRLNSQKGIDRAVELIALLARRGVNATLHAYGRDDGAKAELVAQAERLGVAERIVLPGVIERDGRARAASHASFFLQLSRFEGMCMGAVEGMQLGLVPVTTATGQMKTYVQPGATGVLVDTDRLDDAADVIEALLADPSRYRALSDGARGYWAAAPLYAEDVCLAARELTGRTS